MEHPQGLEHPTELWWPQVEWTPAFTVQFLLCSHVCLSVLHQDLLATRDPETHPHGAAVKAGEVAGNSCTREGLRVYCTHECPHRLWGAALQGQQWLFGLASGSCPWHSRGRCNGQGGWALTPAPLSGFPLLTDDLHCTISPALLALWDRGRPWLMMPPALPVAALAVLQRGNTRIQSWGELR